MLPSASILPSHNPLQAPSFIRTSNASFMRRIRRNYDSWDHRLEYSMNENGRSSGWLETGRCVCSEKIQCLVKSSEIWWNRSIHPLYVYFLRPKFVKSNKHMTTFYFISSEIVQLVAIPMQMKQPVAITPTFTVCNCAGGKLYKKHLARNWVLLTFWFLRVSQFSRGHVYFIWRINLARLNHSRKIPCDILETKHENNIHTTKHTKNINVH